MKKVRYIGKYLWAAAIALLLAAGAVVWYFFAEKREEAKALKVVRELAENVNKNGGENPAVTLLKLKSAADLFDEQSTIAFGKNFSREYNREELLSSLTRYRALLKSLRITLTDPDVEILPDGQAKILLSGEYSVESKVGTSHSDVCDITVDLIKKDGNWKIKKLYLSKMLQ